MIDDFFFSGCGLFTCLFHFLTYFFTFFFHFPDIDAVFPEFVEIADGFIRYILGFLKNGSSFLIGFLQDFVPTVIEFFLAFLQLLFQRFGFGFVFADLELLLFQDTAAFFQIGDHIFKGLGFFVQLLLCMIDNTGRQAQFSGNGKSVALAGDSDQQPVSGT